MKFVQRGDRDKGTPALHTNSHKPLLTTSMHQTRKLMRFAFQLNWGKLLSTASLKGAIIC
jgi:hypothetical protein